MTVLAFERQGQRPLREQLPDARVITWPEPRVPSRFERLNAMMKPAMFGFTSKIREWLRSVQHDGERFDLAHFLLPSSPRYPVPFYRLGLPYIVGPVGGALPNPPGFKSEMEADSWFVRLRALDGLRFAHDPWLRRSYGAADMVLFVAPYMRDVMQDVPMRRHRAFLGLGLDEVPDKVERHAVAHEMELLHVGRAVRSKGLR
ncbi:MAG: glycosyltransferase family 1 protein, partial [Myxococcales bacterium]|nr:glycosyltransferase family 1 protein [Myxococcales bacterium]